MKIAFTGHRRKLWRHPGNEEFMFVEKLSAYLSSISEPYTFIVGGCNGLDHWAGTYAISHKIPFDLYVPFPLLIHARTKGWTKEEQFTLLEHHKRCQTKRVVSDTFDVNAYFTRDIWMANDCDLLISWYFKPNSGTGKCTTYAKSINKPIINLRTWKG